MLIRECMKMMRTRKIFAVILTIVIMASFVSGCASRKSETAVATAPSASQAQDTSSGYTLGSDGNLQFTEDVGTGEIRVKEESANSNDVAVEADGIRGTGFSGGSASTTSTAFDILEQRKVIRNANLSMEVDDFYNAYGNLQAMINGIGYISDSNIHRDFYTYDGERKSRITGDITLRIDARHFDNILNDIKGLGEVIDDRIYSSDVTEQYFDTEGRLKILKIEYDHLEEYMRSLTKPDDIFKTRMRMTELQTEIERLTGTLNKWNNLVELSTIYISLTEKYPDEIAKKQENTYWDRIVNAFSRSITGVVNAFGDLLIFIIEAIPTLIILALLAWIAYRVVKKVIGRNKRKAPEDSNDKFQRNAKTELGVIENPDDKKE